MRSDLVYFATSGFGGQWCNVCYSSLNHTKCGMVVMVQQIFTNYGKGLESLDALSSRIGIIW